VNRASAPTSTRTVITPAALFEPRKNTAVIILPKLLPNDALRQARMAAMHQRASGIRPPIGVRQTAP
jgi:hypothetical protein